MPSLQYPLNGEIGVNSIQNWWGNTVYMNTADANGAALREVPEGSSFG